MEIEAHPLVATRSILASGEPRLPGPSGFKGVSGRLGRGTLATLVAAGEAVFSDARGGPPEERVAWLRAELDDFMARASGRGRVLFTAGAFVVSVAAPLLIGRLPPFRRLPLSRRVDALARLEASPLAPVLIALRAILCLIYYEHPDAAREAGISLGPSRP